MLRPHFDCQFVIPGTVSITRRFQLPRHYARPLCLLLLPHSRHSPPAPLRHRRAGLFIEYISAGRYVRNTGGLVSDHSGFPIFPILFALFRQSLLNFHSATLPSRPFFLLFSRSRLGRPAAGPGRGARLYPGAVRASGRAIAIALCPLIYYFAHSSPLHSGLRYSTLAFPGLASWVRASPGAAFHIIVYSHRHPDAPIRSFRASSASAFHSAIPLQLFHLSSLGVYFRFFQLRGYGANFQLLALFWAHRRICSGVTGPG